MNQYLSNLTGLTACRRLAATGIRSHAAGICVALGSGGSVCERERESVCVCVISTLHAHYRERERERERARERERESEREMLSDQHRVAECR